MWECPAATMSISQAGQISSPATPTSIGYFSYCMDIDMNKIIGTSTAGTPRGYVPGDNGGSMTMFTYNGPGGPVTVPIEDNTMPKISSLNKPSAIVFMFDVVFNPVTDCDLYGGSPNYRNSINPADRFKAFSNRHSLGGQIIFTDGHAQYYKDAYITNGMTQTMWNDDEESPLPDVVWDPAYRVWIGH